MGIINLSGRGNHFQSRGGVLGATDPGGVYQRLKARHDLEYAPGGGGVLPPPARPRRTFDDGPAGMPGSTGYVPSPKGRENYAERAGLYWTGDRVAQGRPVAEIEGGLVNDTRRTNADVDRAQAAVEQGKGELALKERELKQRAGESDRDFQLRNTEVDSGIKQRARELDLREKANNQQFELGQGELRARQVGILADVTPETQPAANLRLGWGDGGIISGVGRPEKPAAPVKVPDFVAPETASGVAEALQLDPSDEDYDAQLAAIGKRAGGLDAVAMRRAVETYGPVVEQVLLSTLGDTPAGKALQARIAQRAKIAARSGGR